MFLVCEPISWEMEHVPFNTALLKTIRIAFPDEKIRFYAENGHSAFVREQIGKDSATSISWKYIAPPPRHARFFKRLKQDFRTVKFLLDQLEEAHNKGALVITGNSSILWALKYYTARKHKNINIQTIIHGDFSTLSRTPRKEILNPFYYIGCLKTALRLPGYSRIQHIVLEESVKNRILVRMPFLKNNLFVFDHPVPIDEYQTKTEQFELPLDTPIHFGYLGRATDKKGFSLFLKTASEISERFPGAAQFHLVGKVSEKISQKNQSKMAFLSEMPGKDRLSRVDYVERLKRLHYVCMFYEKYYEYCASGVLLDSIAYGKPIIGSELEMFKNIQNRFGEIGYLCNKNEVIEKISDILILKDVVRYRQHVKNLRRINVSRSPERLALKYREFAMHKN